MPVKNKTSASEYQQKFPWRESYRSASYRPSNEDLGDAAGVPSTKAFPVMEPPIQRRKKPVELVGSFDSVGVKDAASMDDYFLIGNQKKFAGSVKYRNRAKFQNQNVSKSQENEEPKPSKEVHKPPPPPPKVMVNTGASPPRPARSHKNVKKIDKAVETNGQVNGVIEDEMVPTPNAPRREKHVPPPAPKVHPQGTKIVPILKGKPHAVEQSKLNKASMTNKVSKSQSQTEVKHQQKDRREVTHPPKASKGLPDQREKRKGQMNEFAQTNLDKGLADSAPEAPANYALKYKAGIPPPRAKSAKRVSEYQLQYKWRDAVPSAPVLAAEQIIYNSNPQVGPYKADKLPKKSEYNAQFQAWEPKVQHAQRPDSGDKGSPAKKQKLQRSKSVEALSPAERPAAGVQPITQADDKRLVKSSVNPQKLHFPHGKIRKSLSEYRSNFMEPAQFSYDHGVWRGADPPHIQTRQEEQLGPVSACTQASWYSEVVELRKKAQEYKRRAQGTHFSKEHLAQLFAQQNQLWDTVSNRSTLSALSLERPQAKAGKQRDNRSVSSEGASANGGEPGAREAWADDEYDEDTISAPASSSREPAPTPPPSVASQQTTSSVGRIPTPVLRHSSSSQRHHLDRTTPVVGGTLLASPPRSKVKAVKKGSSPNINSGREDMVSVTPPTRPQESASAPAILSTQKVCCTCGANRPDGHDGGFTSADLPLSTCSKVKRPGGKPVARELSYGSMTEANTKQNLYKPVSHEPLLTKKTTKSSENKLHHIKGFSTSYTDVLKDSPPKFDKINKSGVKLKESRYSGLTNHGSKVLQQSSQDWSVRSTFSSGSRKTTPTFGMPTHDTHVLVDDDASQDRPLATEFVHTPIKERVKPPGVLSTIPEGSKTFDNDSIPHAWQGDYEGVAKMRSKEDDILSTSARSLASSASLASEVYERARKHREQFWGNK